MNIYTAKVLVGYSKQEKEYNVLAPNIKIAAEDAERYANKQSYSAEVIHIEKTLEVHVRYAGAKSKAKKRK